ncbi:crotonobetaine/carnitine-CoA ligase [Jatrophihabitans sp. GAS493]|uniref:AMP-binding protein n=1 Tax=Jatrophihabitans sp. GAS493 TaxID=1907575 RepID=UPI000BB6F122|nr:AMP-binding protein [Jatrophihabitans sp. GAS493]SOD72104.1 crotonobetaine/carnitine-CoA ligase [Jatrophihabitans sp. GAS493]
MTGLPEISERTLQAAWARALEDRPEAIAHVDGSDEWTFAQSYARIGRLAGGIESLGVGHQHPVALLLDNSVDFVHLWMALGLGGQIEVPISTAYKYQFLTHVLNDSGAQTLVIEDAYVGRLLQVAADLKYLQTVVIHGDPSAADLLRGSYRVLHFSELEEHGVRDPVPGNPAALLAYMYTSGTTGASKGVMCSHAHAYTYASREDDTDPRPRPGDRVLLTLPMFHIGGQWSWVYQALIQQATCVIETGFSVSKFWAIVREQKITVTGLLGSMAELLWQRPAAADDADNPLEIAVMAPMPSDRAGFCKRFQVQASTAYGMSEIGRVMDGPVGSVVGTEAGFRRDCYELRLVDERGTDMPIGQSGELWVRPVEPLTVMSGYLNRPESNAEMMVDGWLHTGDVLRCDETGRYYFVDRVKDALRRRGENVSSFEVESVINQHPAVLESAVVAVRSQLTEDEIRAIIVLREGYEFDPEQLTGFLIERLPYFMVPRYLETASSLPRTPTQKVRKFELRTSELGPDVWDREAAGIRLRSRS